MNRNHDIIMFSFTERYQGIALSVLRIATGLFFMQHGVQKLFGWLGGFGGNPGATAELASMMGLAGVLETFGGLLIAIGLLTRPVALLLAVQMVAAYFMAHLPQGGLPMQNGGELALLFAFVFLYLGTSGAGPLSVDAALAGRDPARDRVVPAGARSAA